MKSRSAYSALLCLSAVSLFAADAPPRPSSIIAKSHYHEDKSHTESKLDMTVRELEEKTFNSNGSLQMRKHYLVNEKGQPTQGNVYDGRDNLVARSMMIFDEFGRVKEMRSANLQGEVFQQILYSYDSQGKALKPKVMNYDTKAPTIKPQTIDLRGLTPPPGQQPSQFQQNLQPAGVDMPGAAPAAPANAPVQAPAPAEAPKKKSFWKRLFSK